MFPPAVECGELLLTAFCRLTPAAKAACSVSAFWIPICAPPGPPQPKKHEDLPPPTFWVWSCFCVVSASFDDFASASELATWLAELGPEVIFPPATLTGTFALTAFGLLIPADFASCSVLAAWMPSCAPPAPPQPTLQEEPSTFWVCVCF